MILEDIKYNETVSILFSYNEANRSGYAVFDMNGTQVTTYEPFYIKRGKNEFGLKESSRGILFKLINETDENLF